ncbi:MULTISPECIES: FAD-binding oxidoreductase [Thermomonospora]|uniref:FAD linked oxidase domain protein n=1 Tax=Thermomonospora curvata (strain ATCC 19995 / DSM 43183 / JCM 3096 / KCTC 9072 / NBRC 15933 / NCIMB 10081 / Henssen B9) TaxID=471852 RepID=D1ADK6_THECD|nr:MULTISPECIES: FAD-binding oxidoreductase [Thermomonospora]ACY95716.1 FAD linked oxidase domain protein [Thermomonospora curvata DSM 43183]PKK16305.1 MAG: FAD-binding oxidoreductase [Thermomonospora sp. CIF 1]
MADVGSALADVVGAEHVLSGEEISADYGGDEALGVAPQPPAFVVRPETTEQVAGVLRVAGEHGLAVTPRGSGTGLSGGAVPVPGGLVLSLERMNRVLEIDTANHVAVVQAGVTLGELDRLTAEAGLIYPVFPGESSASIGGTVSTNAGGMHAVKYGVTRHQVLGLEAVLAGGEVIRTGGRYVKTSTGYDLTQLIVGSEGTLAVVTEATLRLRPRAAHQASVLAPFSSLREVTAAVPKLVGSGLDPLILEYVDMLAMAAITANADVDLGVPEQVRQTTQAYLIVTLENRSAERLEADIEALGGLLTELGAADVYVLESNAARELITAREKAFWAAKSAGADAIVDAVIPRADLADFFEAVGGIGERRGTLIVGCGHAGDGNVHLSVFQPDPEKLTAVLREIFTEAMGRGGAISGEHGIGREKRPYFLDLEDPVKLRLMRQIKQVFDPQGILNPGVLFD